MPELDKSLQGLINEVNRKEKEKIRRGTLKQRICRECQKKFIEKIKRKTEEPQQFCTSICRSRWHNAKRAQELKAYRKIKEGNCYETS